MGKYDDITEARLRADLVAFAELILRLDREGDVLAAPAEIQRLMGDLRQKLFAFEVRCSRLPGEPRGGHGEPREGIASSPEVEDQVLRESLKVVREALRRSEEMIREWDGLPLDEEEDERE
jgi:hypothetical protein